MAEFEIIKEGKEWQRSDKPRVKIICKACRKPLAKAYLTDDVVYIDQLSIFDGAGIANAPGEAYRITCTRASRNCRAGSAIFNHDQLDEAVRLVVANGGTSLPVPLPFAP